MNDFTESEERELKFIVTEEKQAKILASIRGKGISELEEILNIVKAALRLAEFEISSQKTEIIKDEYFDTDDMAIFGSHAAFRVRRSGEKTEVTVKTPKESQLGLFTRQEKSRPISEETYSDLARTGFWDITTEMFPNLKNKSLSLILRVDNERRAFSLERRGEQYALYLDLFTFTNPRTHDTDEAKPEVEIEALNQFAKNKLESIRTNLVGIVKAFDESRESKYERGVKHFGLDRPPWRRWIQEKLNTSKGLTWFGIIVSVILAVAGIIISILLGR